MKSNGVIPEMVVEDASDTASENESEYDSEEEGVGGLLLSKKETSTALPLSARVRLYFTGIDWKNVFAAVCLWIAFTLCSAAFSMIAPFFPQEVATLS